MLKYQDALFKERRELGERDCEARWQMIEPHLPSRGIVSDVGSNVGFLALRSLLASGATRGAFRAPTTGLQEKS
jgi:hypothetical protein